MEKELRMVRDFHQKFKIINHETPSLISKEDSEIRFKIMDEEVKEYLDECKTDELPKIAKELGDILYTTYGTIVSHGLQDKMPDIFEEIHRSNMSKEIGIQKMVKGKDFIEADIKRLL